MSSAGKGKDFSRMQQPPAPPPAPAPPSQQTPPKTESPPSSGGKKGKDFSRMVSSAPPPPAPAPTSDPVAPPRDSGIAAPPPSSAGSVASPGGKPKGKDLSRMGGVQRTGAPTASAPPPAAAALPSTAPAVAAVFRAVPNPAAAQVQWNSTDPPASKAAEDRRSQNVAGAADPAPTPTAATMRKTAPPSRSEASLSAAFAAAASPKKYGEPSQAPLLGAKLQTICQSISPSYALDSKVQESLLQMADSFVEKVVSDAIKLAKHRGSKVLDVVDVALALKKGYGIEVEGLGAPSSAAAAGAGNANAKNKIGGWLFSNKVGASARVEGKKRRLN